MRSISTYLSSGWNLYKTHFAIMIQFTVLVALLSLVKVITIASIISILDSTFSVLFLLIRFAAWVITLWLSIALMGSTYEVATGHTVSSIPLALSRTKKYIIPALVIYVLTSIIIFFGFIFLIVPGIIFSLWYIFALYPMIIKGKSIMDSMRESRIIVRGKLLRLFATLLAMTIVVSIFVTTFSIIGNVIAGLSGVDILSDIVFLASMYLALPYITLLLTMMYIDLDAASAKESSQASIA